TARVAQLQLVEGAEHRAQARSNIIGRTPLATTRGVLRDREGRVLAANRPSYNVYVVPDRLDLEQTWPAVVRYMGLGTEEEARLRARIESQTGRKRTQQMLLK